MIKVRKKPLEKCLGTYSFLRFQYCSHVEKIPTNLVMMSMTVCFDIFSRAFFSQKKNEQLEEDNKRQNNCFGIKLYQSIYVYI